MKQPAHCTQIYYILWHIYTVLQCTDVQHQRMLPIYPVGWVDNDDDRWWWWSTVMVVAMINEEDGPD